MKALYKILPLFAAGALLASCNEMDTEPNAGYVTEGQKQEVVERNPEMLAAGVATLPALLKPMQSTSSRHDDYGVASIGLKTDSRGMDMMAYNVGFNWYSGQLMWTDYTDTAESADFVWRYMYNMIYSINNVLRTLPEDLSGDDVRFNAAQAYAFRAYAYFMLAQHFQYTYKGNEDKPCVPLITEENSEEVAAAGGAPRASVQDVYTQIKSDIDTAIELLDGTSYTAATDAANKMFIYLNVAYGLRARINLVMNNWGQAASDADNAIQLSQAKGLTPYTFAELINRQSDGTVQPSGFYDGNDHSWMWDINYTKDDTQYQWTNTNFVSFASSFSYSGGYTTLGAWRYAGAQFYNNIPSSDVRKLWWINPYETHNGIWWNDPEDGHWVTMPSAYVSWVQSNCKMSKGIRYLNVKFNRLGGMAESEARTGDNVLMRVEEMYMIKAEAEAMAGNPGTGAQTLRDFVTTYRDPQYSLSASSAEAVQEAVWNQRRIEFWGEGISYLDILRLKKGIDRRGQGFEPAACYNIPATDLAMIYMIPRSEADQNPNLGGNNEKGNKPTAVTDTETYNWEW